MTTISIAMTSYNASTFILEQLQSFAAQTRLPDELVISDDGSVDDTAAIVERFARTVSFPVRFLPADRNLGMNMNFSRAVAAATGDLVFMSDDDDVWFAAKLATIEPIFADPAILMVVNDQVIADDQCRPSDRTVLQNVRRLGYGDVYYGTGSCTAIRRALLPILLPFPGKTFPYDHWTNHLSHVLGVRHLVETPLQLYRRHAMNMTASLLADDKASLAKMVTAGRDDRTGTYADLIARLDVEAERIAARTAELAEIGLAEAGRRALAGLQAERQDHEARLHALAQPRHLRPFNVLRNLAAGRYRRFQGWKSAAKDLLV